MFIYICCCAHSHLIFVQKQLKAPVDYEIPSPVQGGKTGPHIYFSGSLCAGSINTAACASAWPIYQGVIKQFWQFYTTYYQTLNLDA